MKLFFAFLLLFTLSPLSAQQVTLEFNPVLNGEALDFPGATAGAGEVKKSSGLTVETLRFYLNDVVLLKGGTRVA